MLQTLKNAGRTKDLKMKILFTIFILLVILSPIAKLGEYDCKELNDNGSVDVR